MPPRAAYIHVPFCRHHCGYCNFTVVAGRDDLIEQFLAAIERELSVLETPRAVDTLFIGGGTPTHLPPPALGKLLAIIRRWFALAGGGEFSVEANPADISPEIVGGLVEHGVTRVSLGAQSFNTDKLKVLERDHGPDTIRAAVEDLRAANVQVSLDLIFAAPGETLAGWQDDLAQAMALAPDHVSTYGLTFERGTTFWGRRARGELRSADEELERDMYLTAIDTLTGAGFEHYEVSNFARPGHRCRHNEVYWAGEEYYAAGPGAARYVGGRREMNHRSTTTWIKRVLAGESPVAESETLSPEDRAREGLVLALRRREGIARDEFAARFGYSIGALGGASLTDFTAHGLIEDDGRTLRLSRAGLLVSDALWSKLLRR
ncbi:MAG TPA: radical SAM family heme chaperone HemW [Pirellulales bacterium]|nr:radical SAM family heme chaperone HemW [Pirellulales bacterium]